MKASLKFRDDRPPLAGAKMPMNILGLPFLAGAAAGEPSDLRLDLTTAIDSGPAFRVSYRPNEPFNPFTLSIKTGLGPLGSPIASPFSMITEFNLFSSHRPSGSPVFSIVFKPRIGDFSLTKLASSSSSSSSKAFAPVSDGPRANGKVSPGGIEGIFSGVELTARSVLPIFGRGAVGCRWGLKMPREFHSSFSMDRFSMTNLPMLVLNKISIKHIPDCGKKRVIQESGDDVAKSEVRKEILALQIESAALRKMVERIREKIDDVGCNSGKMFSVNGNKDGFGGEGGKRVGPGLESSKRERWSEVKSVSEDVNEELKKALMSAGAPGK